jgi:SagB-type dehydrogenase family enzyme
MYELEIYVIVRLCQGLSQGVYHYDPLNHHLEMIFEFESDTDILTTSGYGMWNANAIAQSPQVILVITARFGRLFRKYRSVAYALVLKHVGILKQNFYLVATNMGLAPTAAGVGDSDAFAQIIKELVDNAVDACNSNHSSRDDCGIVKKVRVIIKQVGSDDANQGIDEFTTKRGRTQTNSCHDDSDCAGLVNQNRQELLRIEVTDNGCGMANVEKCVSAFSSSKNGDSTKNSVGSTSISEVDEAMNSNRSLEEGRTAGRYGIGLTLCILHATRLVPNSCVVIKSTVEKSGFINKFKFVVDTQRDNILCIGREKYAKKEKNSSGTTVALLLPVSEMLRNSDYVVNLFKNCITYSPSKFSVGRD